MSVTPAETHAASLDKASASALEVLDRFSQRNRNQHRVAKWWSQVGILRRALRRLLESLHAQENHLITSRKNLGARQKLSAKSSAATDQHRESVVARATWLCTHVLPQAYISFTQVAADKQHAALGLFLVGLVAFLQQSLRPLVPEPQPTPLEQTVSMPAPPGLGADEGDDMGVAVSRTMFDAKKPSPGSAREAPVETTKRNKPTQATTTPAAVAVVASGASGAPSRRKRSPEVTAKESKVKRKKKKGDDFANLFGSLL